METVRKTAIDALAQIPDPRAVEILTQLINDYRDVREIRSHAVHALGTRNDTNAVDALSQAFFNHEGQYVIQKDILKSLAKIQHPKALQTLLRAANHENPWLRACALEALGERREAEVVPAFVHALNDKDDTVQRHAINALRERVHISPDIILQLSTDARHRIGRIAQERERNDIAQHLCNEAPV